MLESPTEAEELYRYRVPVPLSRPLFQGDLVDGVPLAGFQELQRVAVLTHPCTMREGVHLRPRQMVAMVSESQSIPLPWTGHFRLMPLPGLVPGGHWQVNFDEIHTVDSASLQLDQRVASLEDRGVLLLQQRFVNHLTRYVVEASVLYEACANVLTEAELLENWIEVLAADHEDAAGVAVASAAFDEFIAPSRVDLESPGSRAQVRRAVLAEIERRQTTE